MHMIQNPPSYDHLQVFIVDVPLVWVQVDQGVPGENPESRMGLRCPWQPAMISLLGHSPPSPLGIATGPHDAWTPGSPLPGKLELHQSQVVVGGVLSPP